MNVMFNGRILKNVRKVYKPIAAEIPELCEYLETTKVHLEEEFKFNQRLFEYRWGLFLYWLRKRNRPAFDMVQNKKPESLFREQHKNGEVNYLVVCEHSYTIRVDKKEFAGVYVAGTKFTWS